MTDHTDDSTDGGADGSEAADPDSDQTPSRSSATVDLDDPRYYLNRELSKLAFQRRVLHEALDDRNPLLERAKFLGILTSNLDEFFMKRIGGLKQQIAADVTEPTPDGRTPNEQWQEAIEVARDLFHEQSRCYREEIRPALAREGIRIVDYASIAPDQQETLRSYFESSVLPTLTPLTFDPAHPFPHISNLSLSLAVLTREDDEDEPTFSRVKIPGNRPRLVQVGDNPTYVPLEKVVAANLDLLFPDVEILECSLFRVTRNAEVRRNEEIAEDLIETIEDVLRQRRFATVVRLELEPGTPDRVRQLLIDQLELAEREVFELPGLLDYTALMSLAGLDHPDLKLDDWTPQPHPRLVMPDDTDRSIFETIWADDLLVHHPYHSFDETVHRFIDAAATDPNVLAIKAAIYRTASDSQVIESLIKAARNGKQVAVMVELKARFDEENNLRWVRKLEEEGIHVAYGTLGYKTHTKTTLVVREEGPNQDVRLYSHVGTGNYHSETAKTYTDLGLLTADPDIGQDLVKLFNFFTGHALHEDYRELLIAPENMRERFTQFIRREAEHARTGGEGRIVAKMNRLEDPEIVRELYKASMAGVDIDLIVRDICRLRPGLEEVSETIDIYSIVGRFLEHSRIFYFENDGEPEYYIGSADWMTRNLDNRIEAITPIDDPELRAELDFILTANLEDNYKRWRMRSDGSYEQCHPAEGDSIRNTQERLMERAREAVADLRHDPTNGSDTRPSSRPDPDPDHQSDFTTLVDEEE